VFWGGDFVTPGGIAILTVCGGILIAMIGGWVELRKGRIAQQSVEHEVTPNSGHSMRDQINDIKTAVGKLGDKLDKQSERLVRVETIVNDGRNRRATDR